MNPDDIKKLLQNVNKKSPNNNIWFTSIRMVNAYLTNHFIGTENDILKKEYALRLFTYVLEFLNDSKNLTGQNFNVNILENFINEIRKDTYDYRKDTLFNWINCVAEKKQHEDDLTQYLLIFYPSISHITEVRKQLGLNYAVV